MERVRLVVEHDPKESDLGRKAYDYKADDTYKTADVIVYDLLKRLVSMSVIVNEAPCMWYKPPRYLSNQHLSLFAYLQDRKPPADESVEPKHVVVLNLAELTLTLHLKNGSGGELKFEKRNLDRGTLIELLFKTEAFLPRVDAKHNKN